MLVQDTKRPNREPVEMDEEGLKFLQREFGDRYKPTQKIVVPESIKVTPIPAKKEEVATPAKAKKGQ